MLSLPAENNIHGIITVEQPDFVPDKGKIKYDSQILLEDDNEILCQD